jgi:hypothetical protein
MKKKTSNILGRETLLTYFRNGKKPSEDNYSDLINSMMHQNEDGFSKDDSNGLKIFPEGEFNTIISFYKDRNANDPFFLLNKEKKEPDSLVIQPFLPPGTNPADTKKKQDAASVFFHTDGKMGIGKECDKRYKVDVNGFIGMEGRMGTFKSGKVQADGKWHPVIRDLENGQAFEILARTGIKGSGKFAIMHAIALSVFGPKGGKIRKTNAYFGGFWNRWNKLNLRWTGSSKNYSLELRSNSNYEGIDIYYSITQLWDDKLFMDDKYYYTDKVSK